MLPGHELAQAWGYVVAGYSLVEQGLKAVLYVRGGEPKKGHELSVLFTDMPPEDRDILRTYYDDFRHTFPGAKFVARLSRKVLALTGGSAPDFA